MKKYIYKTVLPALVIMMGFSSCTDFLTEDPENGKYTDEMVWKTPQLAEGVLLKAYDNLPNEYTAKDDWATDDMVTNVLSDATVNMANGGWTSRNNPLSNYNATYTSFLYINSFLAKVNDVRWTAPTDTTVLNKLYARRLEGEAYALRAWYGAELLKKVGGMANGQLMGYPIVTEQKSTLAAAQVPRNTYRECVDQIIADCDSATNRLPLIYSDIPSIPVVQGKYAPADSLKAVTAINAFAARIKVPINPGKLGADINKTIAIINRVFGIKYLNRVNGIAAMHIKSAVALRAASPAFATSGITWAQAAQWAADVLTANKGLAGLNAKDVQFYLQVDDAYLKGQTEVLWGSSKTTKSQSAETNNMPPSLFGKGQINPSQNLVNAFPDKNGYPITASALYVASTPYANRDPRLDKYIYRDNLLIATVPAVTIRTAKGYSIDATDSVPTATRTSYYMRKLIDEKVKLSPTVVGTPHYYAYIRYTETLLNFAEAANEAGGPDAAYNTFTARAVINAIRNRAGITSTTYVAGLDKAGMTQLIRNERRIELCFEGFRFWDLRRWMDTAKINESIIGAKISNSSEITYAPVEARSFADYMLYGPIPYDETLKYNLVQNTGW